MSELIDYDTAHHGDSQYDQEKASYQNGRTLRTEKTVGFSFQSLDNIHLLMLPSGRQRHYHQWSRCLLTRGRSETKT